VKYVSVLLSVFLWFYLFLFVSFLVLLFFILLYVLLLCEYISVYVFNQTVSLPMAQSYLLKDHPSKVQANDLADFC